MSQTRYFLFIGRAYESYGGLDDLRGSFETLQEAQEAFVWSRGMWAHIAIVEDGELKKVSESSARNQGWIPSVAPTN